MSATKFMGSKMQLPKDWCAALSMNESTSEQISNEVLDLYEKMDTVIESNIFNSTTRYN